MCIKQLIYLVFSMMGIITWHLDCVYDSGDDFIGRSRIDLSTQDLQAVLPEVGDEYIETVDLFPCIGDLCGGDLPDYTFTYRITRLPDVRGNLHSLLAEAMQRSGIRSELEAIAAGLRSLQAPSPRKIEPENQSAPWALSVEPSRKPPSAEVWEASWWFFFFLKPPEKCELYHRRIYAP